LRWDDPLAMRYLETGGLGPHWCVMLYKKNKDYHPNECLKSSVVYYILIYRLNSKKIWKYDI
jgi:hypothetical protein